MEPIFVVVAIAAIGGIIRAILGYEYQADEGEHFDYVKAAKSVVRGAIGGVGIVYINTILTGTPITEQLYLPTLILAVGADVVAKELYGSVKG